MDKNLYCAEDLYAWIGRRCSALADVIAQKEAKLKKYPKNLPAGSIRVSHSGARGVEQFYLRNRPGDKTGKYLKKTPANMNMIECMIQKEYDEKILLAAKTEYNYLKRAVKFSAKDPLIAVYESMGTGKQKWIKPVFQTPEQHAEAWQSQPCGESRYKSENLLFTTKRGEQVRSKSEVLIANALFDHNISYRYECPMMRGSKLLSLPDFTVLNVRKRKEYYWEHFGMMSDPEYSRSAMKKIGEYEKCGMFPGREMIYTFESSDYPLDLKIIEQVIRTFL